MEKIEICATILVAFGVFLTMCIGPSWSVEQERKKGFDNHYSIPMIISLLFVFIGAMLFIFS